MSDIKERELLVKDSYGGRLEPTLEQCMKVQRRPALTAGKRASVSNKC